MTVNWTGHKVRVVILLAALCPLGALAQVVITQQPQSQNLPTGATLSLTVVATGTGPLSYQWRLNGVNIPGATSSLFTVGNFQPANSGDYSVAVSDVTGAVNSDVASIRASDLAALPFTDAMNGQNQITGSSGIGSGSNVGATREPGEPNHAGRFGTNSVWLTWQAPLLGGVFTLDTAGSSFDTLLAVYTGDAVGSLTLVASNDDNITCDDSTHGFHTSRVRFNARGGTVYHIAVDGLSGTAGDIVLSWRLNLLEDLLPVLTLAPTAQVGLPGDDLSLSVTVQGINLVTYQWYRNCEPIPGATQSTLALNNLQPSQVGNYVVRVTDILTGAEIISEPASVQINITDGRALDVLAFDKFPETADSAIGNPPAAPRLQKAARQRSPIRKLSGGLARGFRGSQVFSTKGSSKDPGEPNHCGEAGGASEWYAYQPPANGVLHIDTDGSDYDTVLAVYTGPGTDFASLVPVTCDNNNGANGKTSKVTFRARQDTVYFIAVDGVGGASGTVVLDYDLNTLPSISSVADTATDEDTPLSGVPFTVSDAETATSNLVVTCSSSNPALVPDGHIVTSGTDSNRTMTIWPVSNQSGTTTITIQVTDDDGGTGSTSFLLTVNAVNDPPTISSIADQTINQDTPTAPIPFSIADMETDATGLIVTGHSSNQGLVPDANISFNGTGPDRTVTIKPASGQYGTSTININVADPDGASAASSFVLTVNRVNVRPTISSVANQVTVECMPTAAIPFTVGDVETPAAALTLTGRSSNPALVPDAKIVFGGAGAERTVTVCPASSQSGTSTITIAVADADGGTASATFELTVTPGQQMQLVSSSVLSSGAIRLRLTGSPLQNAIIQISTNLSRWQSVFTNYDQTNLVEWIDVGATDRWRFYRAVR